MQGRDDGQRQLLDVESMAGHMLPAGSVFRFLADHRHELFPDETFADLFPSGVALSVALVDGVGVTVGDED